MDMRTVISLLKNNTSYLWHNDNGTMKISFSTVNTVNEKVFLTNPKSFVSEVVLVNFPS